MDAETLARVKAKEQQLYDLGPSPEKKRGEDSVYLGPSTYPPSPPYVMGRGFLSIAERIRAVMLSTPTATVCEISPADYDVLCRDCGCGDATGPIKKIDGLDLYINDSLPDGEVRVA